MLNICIQREDVSWQQASIEVSLIRGLQICYGAGFLLEETSRGSSGEEKMFIDG